MATWLLDRATGTADFASCNVQTSSGAQPLLFNGLWSRGDRRGSMGGEWPDCSPEYSVSND